MRKGHNDEGESQSAPMPPKGTVRTIKIPKAAISVLLEMEQIKDAGFVDYYIMAFWTLMATFPSMMQTLRWSL